MRIHRQEPLSALVSNQNLVYIYFHFSFQMLRFLDSPLVACFSQVSIWIVPSLATCLLLFRLVPFARTQYRSWHLYRQMPTFPTSTFPGILLGHVEFFLSVTKNMDPTVCKFGIVLATLAPELIKGYFEFYFSLSLSLTL